MEENNHYPEDYIPREAWATVFSNLDKRQLERVRLTCHFFCDLIDVNFLAKAPSPPLDYAKTHTTTEQEVSTPMFIVRCATFIDKNCLVIATTAGALLTYDFKNRQVLTTFTTHGPVITKIGAIGSNAFVTHDEHNALCVWHLDSNEPSHTTDLNNTNMVTFEVICEDMIALIYLRKATIVHALTGELAYEVTLADDHGEFTCATVHANGLFLGTSNGTMIHWQYQHQILTPFKTRDTDQITSLYVKHPFLLYTHSQQHGIGVFDLKNHVLLSTIERNGDSRITQILPHQHHETILCITDTNRFEIWNIATGILCYQSDDFVLDMMKMRLREPYRLLAPLRYGEIFALSTYGGLRFFRTPLEQDLLTPTQSTVTLERNAKK